MKKIKVAHLYYDLMNLYGEVGNVRAIEEFIRRQGVSVEVDKLSINDKIKFSKYDLFYIGSGSEENAHIVLSDWYQYREDIKNAIEDGKFFIVTGNAFELFGAKKHIRNSRTIECLGILDFNSKEEQKRIVSEIAYDFLELDEDKGRKIVGFKNCNSNIVNNNCERLFNSSDNVRYKNFFGMMFFGPVLIRNPYFTDYIMNELFQELKLDYKQDDSHVEYRAYHEFLKNFIINVKID